MARNGPKAGSDESAGVVRIRPEDGFLPVRRYFDHEAGDPNSPTDVVAAADGDIESRFKLEYERRQKRNENPNASNRPPQEESLRIVFHASESYVLAGSKNAKEEKRAETRGPGGHHSRRGELTRGRGRHRRPSPAAET